MSWIRFRFNQNAVTARIVWPVAAVLLSLLSLAFLALVWTGQRANELALERQTNHMNAALALKGRHVLSHLQAIAASPERLAELHDIESHRSSSQPPTSHPGEEFEVAASVAPDNTLVKGRILDEVATPSRFERILPILLPTLAELRDRLAQSAMRRDDNDFATDGPQGAGVVRLITLGNALTFVVAVALPEVAPEGVFGPRILVATRPLPLDQIESSLVGGGFDNLQLARSDMRPDASINILDASGAVGARLSWTPDKPGIVVVERVLPTLIVALLAVGLFSGFMFSHVQQVTTELVSREARATHLANHDVLSGLPNRALLTMRLDAELARIGNGSEGAAILFMDLDRFKDINDTFGHHAGDQLIRIVAQRLQGVLRGSDVLARFGGDEFAILQTNVRTPHDCATLAHRILDVIHEPIEMGGTMAQVGVSIGIAIAPENGTDRDRPHAPGGSCAVPRQA